MPSSLRRASHPLKMSIPLCQAIDLIVGTTFEEEITEETGEPSLAAFLPSSRE